MMNRRSILKTILATPLLGLFKKTSAIGSRRSGVERIEVKKIAITCAFVEMAELNFMLIFQDYYNIHIEGNPQLNLFEVQPPGVLTGFEEYSPEIIGDFPPDLQNVWQLEYIFIYKGIMYVYNWLQLPSYNIIDPMYTKLVVDRIRERFPSLR